MVAEASEASTISTLKKGGRRFTSKTRTQSGRVADRKSRMVAREAELRWASEPKQTASADCASELPFRCPLHEVPCGGLVNDVVGFVAADFDADGAGGVDGIGLQQRDVGGEGLQDLARFGCEWVIAETAGDNGAISQPRRHDGKIRGRPAKAFAGRQEVPEQFTEANDHFLHLCRPSKSAT